MADVQVSRNNQHVVDRRINLLAEAITRYVDTLAGFYAPPGGQAMMTAPPMTSEEAYERWSAHRYDDIGKAAVSKMVPLDVAHLDAWLTTEMNARRGTGPVLP